MVSYYVTFKEHKIAYNFQFFHIVKGSEKNDKTPVKKRKCNGQMKILRSGNKGDTVSLFRYDNLVKQNNKLKNSLQHLQDQIVEKDAIIETYENSNSDLYLANELINENATKIKEKNAQIKDLQKSLDDSSKELQTVLAKATKIEESNASLIEQNEKLKDSMAEARSLTISENNCLVSEIILKDKKIKDMQNSLNCYIKELQLSKVEKVTEE